MENGSNLKLGIHMSDLCSDFRDILNKMEFLKCTKMKKGDYRRLPPLSDLFPVFQESVYPPPPRHTFRGTLHRYKRWKSRLKCPTNDLSPQRGAKRPPTLESSSHNIIPIPYSRCKNKVKQLKCGISI